MGPTSMNIQSVKQLVWIGSIALGGALGWEVYDFSKNKAIEEQYVDSERIQKAIYEDVEDDVVVDESPTVRVASLNNGFVNLNWTGKQAPKPKERGPLVEQPVVKPKDKVSDLLTINTLIYTPDVQTAFAYVSYLNPTLADLMPTPTDRVLRVGSSLKGKFSHIEVEAVLPNGLRFKFNGEERESELVEFDPENDTRLRIAQLTELNLKKPNDALGRVSPAQAQSYRRPPRTVETRRNHYQLGTESLSEVNRDYTRILSNDVSYRRARDRNNKIKGIEITKVKSGSIPAEAGVNSGDILISVNGHQVTSESDLIAFIKRESANTTEWESIWESNGKRFTRYYTSPDS